MSEKTKTCKQRARILSLISVALNFGPLGYFIVSALFGDGVVIKKFAIVSSVFVVLIMTLVSLINKKALRSRVWILLVSVYLATSHFATALILVACTQVLDEIVVEPMRNRAKEKYRINKEIDERTE